MFELDWAGSAEESYNFLKTNASQKRHYKAVKKALKLLAQNPKYPSLQTHEFSSLKGPNGEKVWEAYAEQHTSGAYRIFFYYGPSKGKITIFVITAHP